MIDSSYEFPLERSKIREFARATFSKNPAYWEHPEVAPVTFFVSAPAFWAPRDHNPLKGLALDLRRVLHAQQEYEFHGPIPKAGETLTVSSRLESTFEKTGRRGGTMRFVVIATRFHRSNGTLAVTQRSTLVETAKPMKRNEE